MGGNGAYKGKEIVRNQEKCPETEKAHTQEGILRGCGQQIYHTSLNQFELVYVSHLHSVSLSSC